MKGKIARLGVIIRSFNNPDVHSQVVNLLEMGVGRIVVVTDKEKDNGVTPGLLENISDPRLSMHEMSRGYSWSNGLNVGLCAIQMANWERKGHGKPPFDFLLPLSVEARINRLHVAAMLDEVTDSRLCAMVGTSFAGEADGKRVDLGVSYSLPRNTAAIINLGAFQCGIGGFDPQCDQEGGMEDLDLLLRLYAVTGRGVGLTVRMLDLRIPLAVWKHYDQREKEARENRAIGQIVARWRSYYRPGSMEWTRVSYAVDDLFEHRSLR